MRSAGTQTESGLPIPVGKQAATLGKNVLGRPLTLLSLGVQGSDTLGVDMLGSTEQDGSCLLVTENK